MPRDPRFDVLFEPVKIGPVTSRNRFYQVPHCNGLGHTFPKAEARQRGIKAEGGWGVVATQEVEIHPSSEWSPYVEGRLWDEGDMRRLQLTAEAVHAHGSLAAIEITHNGHASGNRTSRLPAMGVGGIMLDGYEPSQAYTMSKRDIGRVRAWHRQAAVRARDIGFDIVYVYAAHDLGLPFHFLSRRHNRRGDEYGGSLENRTRFLREVLEDTLEAVGERCAVAVRFSVHEKSGEGEEGGERMVWDEEGREVVELLADLPDLWDVNISGWEYDSASARFSEEGYQERYVKFVKEVTRKPVVGVGRFTSPDAMVAMVKGGVLDLIGAARPSIADPFLPNKIAEGRVDDIRECIGCNICVSCDMTARPMRCTQNPTVGEEYRRDWHPEQIPPASSDDALLVVGGGAAGLEAALALAQRGYRVTLAEAEAEFGGRVRWESELPGLGSWRRVVDYRLGQLRKLPNAELFAQSELDAAQVLQFAKELKAAHIVLATGARWTRDGVGREHHRPLPLPLPLRMRLEDGKDGAMKLLTPDDILRDTSARTQCVAGDVLVYDDDHYYIASAIAEKLAAAHSVTFVTPAPEVALWTRNTLEQEQIEQRLRELGVTILERHKLVHAQGKDARITLQHLTSKETRTLRAPNLVLVTARRARESLYADLTTQREAWQAAGLRSVVRIGDCLAPGTIAAAVYHGHRFAREFDALKDGNSDTDTDTEISTPFKREYVEI